MYELGVVYRNVRRADAHVAAALGALGTATVHEANEGSKRKRLADGVLGLDMYHMRGQLSRAGLRYID